METNVGSVDTCDVCGTFYNNEGRCPKCAAQAMVQLAQEVKIATVQKVMAPLHPTAEMVVAGANATTEGRAGDAIECYRAMLTVALNEDAIWKPTHQHAEGGTYQVLGAIKVHTGKDTWEDGVLYSDRDGLWFCRTRTDFDGRFKRITP